MFENDYTITGKHATYLKSLVRKSIKDDSEKMLAPLFDRYIDVYMNAAIWGLLYSRTAERDTSSGDRARVYADAFANERDNCVFLYRMTMLLDNTADIPQEERVERAFRYDTQEDKKEAFKENMELFNAYIRGGIEQMYEQFVYGCVSRDDYLHKTYEIVTRFKSEIEGKSYEEELAKLIK